jgi:acetolactate synthase-1/2/3 large subunit
MLHVNVGTANAVCALMNAYRERIPLVVAAGRTPFTETGHAGSRSLFIHWAQEMFDQASLVRETVKWDYEVRMPDQIRAALDRAFSLATSDPRGPVYLTLPREVLAAPVPPEGKPASRQPSLRATAADPAALADVADILAAAERPLIITASLGHDHAAVAALAELAARFAFPVVSHVPKSLCLPTDHPMHLGFAPARLVRDADAILVLECDVPWIPNEVTPPPGAKVIHMGLDPLFARYGIRNFPCDLAVPGNPARALPLLGEALAARMEPDRGRIEARRRRLAEERAKARAALDALYARACGERPIHLAVLSRAIDAVAGGDAILINELGIQLDHVTLTRPGSYFQQSSAAVGDGSYMFGNPTPAHFISRSLDLPVLFVVANNRGWASVRNETLAMYPLGFSSACKPMPLADVEPAPEFEKVIAASGGYGDRVEHPDQLGPALERAVHAVKVEQRQALLNVICRMV